MLAIVNNLKVFSFHFRRNKQLPQVNLSRKEVGQPCVGYLYSSVPRRIIIGI